MGKRSYLHRGQRAADVERGDQAADVEAPPPGDQPPATMLSELGRVPLYTFVSGQPGPQGGRDLWVSVQMNHGLMALAFALHPAMVDAWLRDTGRDMKAMAAKLMRHNSGLTVVESGAELPKRELWVPGSK